MLCHIGVLVVVQGESKFSTWLIMSFVVTTVNSPIQDRCNDWAMVDKLKTCHQLY